MNVNKEEALKKLNELKCEFDKKQSELRRIIEQPCRDIKDVIKSYEDACLIINRKILTINDFNIFDCKDRNFQYYTHRIATIIEALNEGWEPNFNDTNQKKWYPYFDMRNSCTFFASSYFSWCVTGVGFSGRLYLKNKELSDYLGTHFINEFKNLNNK